MSKNVHKLLRLRVTFINLTYEAIVYSIARTSLQPGDGDSTVFVQQKIKNEIYEKQKTLLQGYACIGSSPGH